MFDKVVLCKQGSSILNQVRSRTLSLESGTVKVLLLGGDKIASNWNDIEVASSGNDLSVSLKDKKNSFLCYFFVLFMPVRTSCSGTL